MDALLYHVESQGSGGQVEFVVFATYRMEDGVIHRCRVSPSSHHHPHPNQCHLDQFVRAIEEEMNAFEMTMKQYDDTLNLDDSKDDIGKKKKMDGLMIAKFIKLLATEKSNSYYYMALMVGDVSKTYQGFLAQVIKQMNWRTSKNLNMFFTFVSVTDSLTYLKQALLKMQKVRCHFNLYLDLFVVVGV